MSDAEERISYGNRHDCSQCITCIHNRGSARCDAFPDGIPEEILTNNFDHRQPYTGDHGVQWEPDETGDKHPLDQEKP